MFWMQTARLSGEYCSSNKLKIFIHDIFMACFSIIVAMYLRIGSDAFVADLFLTIKSALIFVITAGVVFFLFGMYRGVWRYASIADLVTLSEAISVAILVFMALMFFIDPEALLPRSVPIIQWFVLAIMLGGPRLSYRMVLNQDLVRWARHGRSASRSVTGPTSRVPVLLVSVCDRAALFVGAMEDAPDAPYHVVGILDDTTAHLGRSMRGVAVLGTIEDLEQVLDRLSARGQRPQKIILTRDSEMLQGARLRAVAELVERAEISLVRLGDFTEMQTAPDKGQVDLRPIALEDLLGRQQVSLDGAAIGKLVTNRRVLITGAGGSIGSELAQQIAALDPAGIILADLSEFNLYSIDIKIGESKPNLGRDAVLLDVRDRERVERIFAEHRPELVFHAAALKHVPMVERHPCEGVLTNVMGTRNVADAASHSGALAMVLISTDKAVSPSSMMGATKRMAEFYCQAADLEAWRAGSDGAPTRFITVRFGNVLGSSGSVVPLFQQQMARGGPLTITHPEIERYFMTVREAAELVLQASAHGMAQADEHGRIYVLDMGEPIRIADIARHLIRLHGKKPDIDVKLKYVGLRPGEKLREELFDLNEERVAVATNGVLAAVSQPPQLSYLKRVWAELEKAARNGDQVSVESLVNLILPDYRLSSSKIPTSLLAAAAPGSASHDGGPAALPRLAPRQPRRDFAPLAIGLRREHSL